VGSLFIATEEANAPVAYKKLIVESTADDVVYTDRRSREDRHSDSSDTAIAAISDTPRKGGRLRLLV
jgi:hypothetical protein